MSPYGSSLESTSTEVKRRYRRGNRLSAATDVLAVGSVVLFLAVIAVGIVAVLWHVVLGAIIVTGGHVLYPCETEDSTVSCYWDADERGNGQGRDFVVLDGTVYISE